MEVDWNKIKFKKLPDSVMRQIGFNDYSESTWLFVRYNAEMNITFHLILKKSNFAKFKINLIDADCFKAYALKDKDKIRVNQGDLNNFIFGIYKDFSDRGLIKGEKNVGLGIRKF